jgi:hypothetical protein
MSEANAEPSRDQPLWRQPAPTDEQTAHQVEHMRRRYLLLDPRYPWDVDKDVLDPIFHTGIRFWLLLVILGGLVAMWLGVWLTQMYWGLGITGLNRPVMWAIYIVNFVYFIVLVMLEPSSPPPSAC